MTVPRARKSNTVANVAAVAFVTVGIGAGLAIYANLPPVPKRTAPVLDVGGFLPRTPPHEVAIRDWLKENTNDPAKLEFVRWGAPRIVEHNGKRVTAVELKFRGANGFGAKVLAEKVFILDAENKVVAAGSQEEFAALLETLQQ